MSYPVTSEERLVRLHGFSLCDLQKLFVECGQDKQKYKIKLEELDKALSSSIYNQITSDKLFVH